MDTAAVGQVVALEIKLHYAMSENEKLRAEVEAQVQVLLRVRRSLWEDLPDEALHTLRDHLTPRGLWEAKEDAHD